MKKRFLVAGSALLIIVMGSVVWWREHRYDQAGKAPAVPAALQAAYFAGGCFWCTEADFEKLSGVIAVFSGYSGGQTEDPSYQSVSSENTGHVEAVEVRYDPRQVSYERLARYFFSHIDPTDSGGQFVDRGPSYRAVAFYQTAEEQVILEKEKLRLAGSGAYEKPLVTEIKKFERFYLAEEYHQDYWKKNSLRYQYYRSASGRDQYLEKTCALREEKNIPCEK